MPSVAFILHVNLPDVSLPSLTATADDILNDLIDAGHDVESVTPWQRPSLAETNLGGLPQQADSSLTSNIPMPKSPFDI